MSCADGAERVRRYLETHGLADRAVHFEQSTKTAAMAAQAIGCELGQIVKSLVFTADGQPLLALVAGDRRGDSGAIGAEMGATRVAFADAETVLGATGYAIGAVSPFDLPDGLAVLIDESLARFEVVYPAGGTASSAVRLSLPEFLAIVGGRLVPIGV